MIKEVYVAMAIPVEKHLSSYVYGVFDTEDQAHEHFKKNGDATARLKVTKEHYIMK